jgi:hypothetical protein
MFEIVEKNDDLKRTLSFGGSENSPETTIKIELAFADSDFNRECEMNLTPEQVVEHLENVLTRVEALGKKGFLNRLVSARRNWI